MIIREKFLIYKCEIFDLHIRNDNDKKYDFNQSKTHEKKHHIKFLITFLQKNLFEK